jgi:CubicO group peptidase (beta-lactamase class C family)
LIVAAFSAARLRRMHDVLASHVEAGEQPGLVTVVSRRGETHVDAIGATAFGGGAPIERDTIFRITSMTKPVTAAAAMLLVEACKLRLDEPVDRLLPELANRKVLKRVDGPLDDTVPAHRPITVRDCLTFRLGIGLIMESSSTWPLQRAMDAIGVGFGRPDPASSLAPDEWLRRLGALPLMYQPGERWMYNTGSYVLGTLIARAADQPLERFLRERLFEPLGMRDTAFSVPASKRDRFVPAYEADAAGTLAVCDAVDGAWSRPPAFPDGAAGLVSTADDFLAFARMLLANGMHGTTRVLSRASVELMTTDHLTPAQKAVSGFFPGFFDDQGWGFGVSVVTRRTDLATTPGRYGWDGGYGTSWANDPREDMAAMLLTQRVGFPGATRTYGDFWTLAYAAMDD